MILPFEAAEILKARRNGMRPAELVIVADGLDPRLQFSNPFVRVDPKVPAKEYDFRFLAGLEVEILTFGSQNRAKALAYQVIKAEPEYLRITYADTMEMWRIVAGGKWDIRPESDWVCCQ